MISQCPVGSQKELPPQAVAGAPSQNGQEAANGPLWGVGVRKATQVLTGMHILMDFSFFEIS